MSGDAVTPLEKAINARTDHIDAWISVVSHSETPDKVMLCLDGDFTLANLRELIAIVEEHGGKS